MRIEIHTTYENVDDTFLEEFIESTNLSLYADSFRRGDKVIYAGTEGEATAITTWQVFEEETAQ